MLKEIVERSSVRRYTEEVIKNEVLTMWFLYEKEMEKQCNYTVFSQGYI